MTTATSPAAPPAYIISRIDAAIRTGVLPIDEPCSPTRALAVVGCLPQNGSYTAEQTAEWINATRIASAPSLPALLDREAALIAELEAAEELGKISPLCAARCRAGFEIEADLDAVRDQIEALAPLAIAA